MRSTIKILTVVLVAVVLLPSVCQPLVVVSARGTVSHKISGCDYFLVETRTGYDLLEWYGGHDADKGDVIIGNFESYGFHDVIDETADQTMHIYTEDYQLSKTSALEKLTEKCE